jgi:CHAD domain-containing protein
MRIALTRLRAVRSFFSSFIPSSEWSPLKGEIKWLNKHLSRARDLDVTLARLHSADDKSPEQSLGRAWRKTWSISHRELSLALRSKRYRMLLRDMSIRIENVEKSSGDPQQSSSLATYSACRWIDGTRNSSKRAEFLRI